ncbi:MAG TPA: 3-isopropylmalate dehydratase large subunit [Planctomycetota bacterium]|jgi:3-isopropylmalate/(R)-2-methylmalate dehydratase large subunit|nr:3-isopropylmalate dehydratase large subunit [Planctomycetota bacterium]OQC22353.1 MAG: 3-isopropylmalate dehydratase large subunit [Planctomycetes bacterium ADurb.Bin069]HNR98818.1 3-isopropylmalate dehydratase large subunit [Planctomycetota bacterium]HNU26594.1 3-isopropylmalate dehydratase large subunit [Planctomycetota bacterium]HOE29196.1 3-isopropylmalate dehydratase large subunit [Planctomycetota bacterium]
MGRNLLAKVWDLHRVRDLPGGATQLFIGLHLIHEVTSPQAFEALRERGLKVARPDLTFAVVDHVVPTDDVRRPLADPLAEEMFCAIEDNTAACGIAFFPPGCGSQGVIHVAAPELGLTRPGLTIACGDSHTSTHGALGAVAFGIGTSQVRDVLATQCLAARRPKVRRIVLTGKLGPWVAAKDVILHIIRVLGVKGGVGFAYELAGPVVERMGIEERLTLCNMGIEGGARIAYCNPDEKTFAYLAGRRYAPDGADFAAAAAWWRTMASDPDASFDDEVALDVGDLAPMVTWGITPGQAIAIDEAVPSPSACPGPERAQAEEAQDFMGVTPGKPLTGLKVNVVFIGSCTNGRLSDLRVAARVARRGRVAPGVRALVVPGSERVAAQAEAEGLADVFRRAGFEWRLPGCSMCLAMNPDRLRAGELCVATSNRNFKGRQGHPQGRTVLAGPAMAAAAALAGEIVDIRTMMGADA